MAGTPEISVSETNVCPKCGMDRNQRDDLLFECGSIDEWCSPKTGTKVEFRQSDQCRIRELENQLAAVTAERDELKRELEIEKEYHKSVCLSIQGKRHAWFCASQIANCDCNCGMQLAEKTAECRRWERLTEFQDYFRFLSRAPNVGSRIFDNIQRYGGRWVWRGQTFPTPLDALAAIEKYEQSNILTEKTS